MRTRLVITGHSRGLGAALAAEAQRRGLAVLGVSRGAGGLPAVEPNATLDWSAPALARGAEVRLDLADQSALQTWVQGGMMHAFFRGSEQALLINNAGLVSPIGPVGRLAVADIFNSVSLNVSAALALASAWVEQTQGVVTDRRLVHVSSGAARSPYAGWNVYCATKAALDHHARCVQLEAEQTQAARGLRVCSLAPGIIDTDMQSQIRQSDEADFPLRQKFDQLKASGALLAAPDVASRLLDYLLGSQFGQQAVADLRDVEA
jgi:benzil reductase ((S)-benzoin forming)